MMINPSPTPDGLLHCIVSLLQQRLEHRSRDDGCPGILRVGGGGFVS